MRLAARMMRFAGGCALGLLALAASPLACNDPAGSSAEQTDGATRILFIGNSYLYTMDVPGIVEALARANGEDVFVDSETGPDMALIDHWNRGTARQAIRSRDWDFVVLQQGPSSVELNRDTLRLGTTLFSELIVASHGRPALFSAWPSLSRRQDFARAIESYQLAAADVGGVFLPVAPAWLDILSREPSINLYEDELHPTQEGAYLAALVVYGRLFNRSPVGMPNELTLRSGGSIRIDTPVAEALQDAAADALLDYAQAAGAEISPPAARASGRSGGAA